MEEEAFKILENAKNYDRKSSTKEEIFCMCFLGAQPLKILVKLAFYPVVTGPKYGLVRKIRKNWLFTLSPFSTFFNGRTCGIWKFPGPGTEWTRD